MRGSDNMKKKNNLLLAALCAAVSLTVMILVLVGGEAPQPGEFTPPPFDASAVAGTPDVPDGLAYSELDCQAYKVALCGKLNANGDIWLTNPEGNDVWLKVRVLDEKGNTLGETGLIRPGEYVQTVHLTKVPGSGTPVTLKIMAYQPDTYHSAGAANLNTIVER